MRIAMIILASTLFSTSAFARCYTNSYRHVVCTNGERAATYNSHTGTTWHSARNEHGVVTTTYEQRRLRQNQKWQRCVSHRER